MLMCWVVVVVGVVVGVLVGVVVTLPLCELRLGLSLEPWTSSRSCS